MKITFKIEFTRPWSSAGWYQLWEDYSWSAFWPTSHWSRQTQAQSKSWSASRQRSWSGNPAT